MGNRERNREPGLTADNAIRFLPFGRPQAYVHTDIRSFTDYVGGAIDTVLDYEPDTDRSEFFYVSSGIEINGLKISASVSSPSRYSVKTSKGFYFMIPMNGSATVFSDGVKGISQSGKTAYFSLDIERKGSTSELSMLQMSVNEERLNFTAKKMLEDRTYDRFKKSINSPHLVSAKNSRINYVATINRICKMIDVSGQNAEILKFLNVDELFYRTLVLMINGSQVSDDNKNRGRAYSKKIAHRVAEFISANRDQRFNQTELEEITGVTYGYISTSFRKNFGCTPYQWLARYRLEMLKLRLEHPNPDDTVASLAFGCGFMNVRSLNDAYASKYGETPRETLTRARGYKKRDPEG